MRTADDIKAEYGQLSPEYALAVYEDMIDGAYERRERAERDIERLSANLEREKAEVMRQRRARRRAAEWRELDEAAS
jgi:hypothetical protein